MDSVAAGWKADIVGGSMTTEEKVLQVEELGCVSSFTSLESLYIQTDSSNCFLWFSTFSMHILSM